MLTEKHKANDTAAGADTAPRLVDALRRLAAPVPRGSGPVFPVADVDALMKRVLAGIDETVLPRELAIKSESDSMVKLVVSNRRLVSVDFGNGATRDGAVEDRDAQCNAVVADLHKFFGSCQTVTIHITDRTPLVEGSEDSFSVDALMQAAGLSDIHECQDGPLDRFLDDLKPMARAWVMSDRLRSAQTKSGLPSLSTALAALLGRAEEASAAVADSRRAKVHMPRCWLISLSETELLVLTMGQTCRFAAILSQSDFAAVAEFWHKRIRE